MIEKLKKLKWWQWLLIIAVVGLIGERLDPKFKEKQAAKAQAAKEKEWQKEAEGYKEYAYLISQGFVKQKLQAPNTADFPLYDFKSKKEGDTYTIVGKVDYKNLFNVPLTSTFICTVVYTSGDPASPTSWHLKTLNFL